MYKTILVPLDGSKLAETALPHAESLAAKYGAKVYLIDDTASITIPELRSKARRLSLEHGLDLIIVDYLQLMSGSTTRYENRTQEISQISRGLKGIAKELTLPLIAVSQLSRAVEARRGDHRPQLSDLRESDS